MEMLQSVLDQVVGDICSSLLSLEVAETAADPKASSAGAIVGCVHVIGAKTGMVAIMCEDSLARYAAATMFNVPLAGVADADVRDAVGELANVVAGNLKAVMPDEHRLSMPSVVSGSDFQTQVLNSRRVAHAVFASGVGSFAVSVFEEELVRGRSSNVVQALVTR